MLARKRIIGPGQIAPSEQTEKPAPKRTRKAKIRMGLLRHLEFRSRRYGYCFESNGEMAIERDVDERTIRRYLEDLEELKLISREYHGPRRRIYLTEAGFGLLRDEAGKKDRSTRSNWPPEPEESPAQPGQPDRSPGQCGLPPGHTDRHKYSTTSITEVPDLPDLSEQVLSRIRTVLSPSGARDFESAFQGIQDGLIVLADGCMPHLAAWNGYDASAFLQGGR